MVNKSFFFLIRNSQSPAMPKKEEGERCKSDPVGSKVKMSFGGGSGVLGKRPAGAITMKLKPQVDIF